MQSKFTENFSKCSKKFCLSESYLTMRFPLTVLSCSAFLITGWKILFRMSLKIFFSAGSLRLRFAAAETT